MDVKQKSCVCVSSLLSHAVCAEAFNPDEDEEEKEPLVSAALLHTFCVGSQRVSRAFDGVARGFAGHAPENRRAEAAAAGGLPGHPPLQEFGSGERSSTALLHRAPPACRCFC